MIIGTHKTSVRENNNGATVIRYHNTNVVTIDQDRMYVTLQTDGHYTNTTKKRMNQASKQFGLGFKVFQKNFDWYIRIGDKVHYINNDPYKINIRTGEVNV